MVSAAPRRSAVSPLSPSSAIDPALPPAPPRPTAPPPITVPAPGVVARFDQLPMSVPTAPTAPIDAPTILPAEAAVVSSPAVESDDTEAAVETPKRRFGRRADKAAKKPKPVRDTSAPAPAPAPVEPDGGAVRKRSAKPAMIIIASVAAVALVVAGTVWALTLRSTAPSGVPNPPASAVDPRLTAADLTGIGGVTWLEPTADADGIRPLCLPAEAEGLPVPQRSVSGRIGSATPEDSVVHVVDTYADEAAASQAYAVRLAQAGTCPDTIAWITGASTVSNLADSAEVVRLTVQDATDVFHTVLLSRTGRTVSLIDIATVQNQVSAADIARVAAQPLNRICDGSGACPGVVEVAAGVPAADNLPGWLVEADLPRITPGAGRWGAADPATTLAVVGSQCEGMNLDQISGTQTVGQRTVLLVDDPNARRGFGVDQATYSFAAPADATKLAKKIQKNVADCADRVPTATVAEGPTVKGTGAGTVQIAGTTYLVTQKTETESVVFRVAVLTVENRVVYLLANPTSDFDFTDDQWRRIALRAGQRASQGA